MIINARHTIPAMATKVTSVANHRAVATASNKEKTKRRLLSAAGRISTYYDSIGKHYFHELTSVRSVTKRMDCYRDMHACQDRLWFPTLSHQAAGSHHLNCPLRRSTSLINLQQEPGVRVRPLKLLDGALQGDLPRGIENRKGMMCKCRDRMHCSNDQSETECRAFHKRLR